MQISGLFLLTSIFLSSSRCYYFEVRSVDFIGSKSKCDSVAMPGEGIHMHVTLCHI